MDTVDGRPGVLAGFSGIHSSFRPFSVRNLSPDLCVCVSMCFSGSMVCLPGWKHSGSLDYQVGSGSAPDGDEDAIVAMILAVQAVENWNEKPSWYDEVRKFADASSSAFLTFNTLDDSSYGDHRLLKLGSCWGGWKGNGQNPSYHSPGSYKLMRDFQASFPAGMRTYTLPFSDMTTEWNRLIATSNGVLNHFQCPLVPNWGRVTVDGNDNIVGDSGSFSGSGTPQYEFGSEASRTIWRVAFDAAMYPSEMDSFSKPYLSGIISQLDDGYAPDAGVNLKFFEGDTVSLRFSCSMVLDSMDLLSLSRRVLTSRS